MSFARADFITDFKASLNDAAAVFTAADDADFERHLNNALEVFSMYVPLRADESITIESGKSLYDAPAGFLGLCSVTYGETEMKTRKPYDHNYPRWLPRARVVQDPADHSYMLSLSPVPDNNLINWCGSDFTFICRKIHKVEAEAENTTVQAEHRGVLMLRCQVEALRELAMRNSKKPFTARDGVSQAPRNGTPAALADQLNREFEKYFK